MEKASGGMRLAKRMGYSIILEKSPDRFNEFGDILEPLNAILFNDLKGKSIIRFMAVFHEPVKKSPPFPWKKFRSNKMGIEVMVHAAMAFRFQAFGKKQSSDGMEHGVVQLGNAFSKKFSVNENTRST